MSMQSMNALYVDIPRLHTAIAQWGACMVFVGLFKRSEKLYKTILKSALLFLVLVAILVPTAPTAHIPLIFWMPIMALSVFVMYVFLTYTTRGDNRLHIYITACAFLFSEFAAALEWLIYYYIGFVQWRRSFWLSSVVMLSIFTTFFTATYFLERKILKWDEYLSISISEAVRMTVAVALVFLFSNLSYVFPNTPFSSSSFYEAFKLRAYAQLMGYVLIIMMQLALREQILANEANTMKLMLRMQYDEYKTYQANNEDVRRKYHDLKHQLIAVRAESDEERRNALIDEMEGELDEKRAHIDCGNPALDALIDSKMVRAKKAGIATNCVVNGKLLDFMHIVDLCTLFGNALDNAIEAEVLIANKDERMIDVTVSEIRGFAVIKVENYMPQALKISEGHIETTKADKINHGYGLKSIRYVAEKYGGNMHISTENDWFTLSIMMPLSRSNA